MNLYLDFTWCMFSFRQGIVTQETGGKLKAFGDQYLVSVYVKFLESAGARAAPILYPLNKKTNCWP